MVKDYFLIDKIKWVLITSLIFISCNNSAEMPKPKKLIEPDKMEAILYELAILQATKNHKPEMLQSLNVDYDTYIYKKFQIDSLQFVENNKYYASDITAYKEMFGRIVNRIETEKKSLDALNKKNPE